jgi:uncharacterized protein
MSQSHIQAVPLKTSLHQWIARVLPSRAETTLPRFRVFNITRQTEIGNSIETADRGPRRRKGLLGRSSLATGEGLWIVPCEAVHTFCMQFAIDLIYLDRRKRVVKTSKDIRPGRISACFRAHSVVELPSGSIARTQTQPGDTLEIEPLPSAIC